MPGPGLAAMLFDDILPANDCSVRAIRRQPYAFSACACRPATSTLILNATTWGSAGALQITSRSFLRNDLEQLRQVAHRVRTPLVCVDLLATRRESLA